MITNQDSALYHSFVPLDLPKVPCDLGSVRICVYEGAHLQECACVWTLACISVSFVCMPVALGVLQFLFDICSSPPVEQVSQESTTCSLAQTGAKETPPPPPPLSDANTRTRTHIYTSCTCSLVQR